MTNPKDQERLREIIKASLDNFAKYAFDEGMRCVKDNIDPKTGLWKMAKKFVDMTEEENKALDTILALFSQEQKECNCQVCQYGEEAYIAKVEKYTELEVALEYAKSKIKDLESELNDFKDKCIMCPHKETLLEQDKKIKELEGV